MGSSIFVRARFDVHDGQAAEFEEVARALVEQAEQEPGTLTFRWFSAGPGSYMVLEEYADPAAALAHNEHAVKLLERAARCADMTYAELHGPVGPDIRQWADAHPQATVYPDLDGA
ncbi:putative quinol monooxygenase [Nonomuraea rhizosphaerae]|uniref:putative quinol monooxygenase n=1 Tax=Nonomuraea rhizosphaerae TaxID=2665663 RepID=UPI001C5DA1EB|nr:antibiotic biosynthesis monooxygenase family protein [Nonomuraea rhizosphaerae]